MNTPFALLDDCNSTPEAPTSRLFTDFVREHRCEEPDDLDVFCARVEASLQDGLHGVLLADYEWGVRLIGASIEGPPPGGVLRVLLFGKCDVMSRLDVDRWLNFQVEAAADRIGGAAGVFGWKADVDDRQFHDAIQRIQQLIAAGETYQINYTYRLNGWARGAPAGLYRLLRDRQRVPYGALIHLPGGVGPQYVLSFSPELFLSFDGQCMVARPMKGTAPVPADEREIEACAAALSSDTKNRAENVMIVDLLRNDLGRIAKLGTVRVSRLFHVSRHGSVLQMTSDVEAEPVSGVSMADVLRAAFPCGSIIGAPKKRSAELIAQIEGSPRGQYTGAIGWLQAAAPGQTLGPFCLSVAIRTLQLGPESTGLRAVTFGVGAGIVADSNAASERAECQLKAAFVTASPAGFDLIETMYTADGAVPLVKWHLRRLATSAAELGFALHKVGAALEIERAARALRVGKWRMRLRLQSDGHIEISSEPLKPLAATSHGMLTSCIHNSFPVRLSRHKTTLREHLDAGVQRAMSAGAFDTLFHTEDGWLVDGGRSNVFVCLNGRWYTPAVEGGALPGVLRSVLLSDRRLGVSERRLNLDDLAQATAVVATNALRGVVGIALAGPYRYSNVHLGVSVPMVASAIQGNLSETLLPDFSGAADNRQLHES
jgi:para-aminobenzoate synthetase/4-amino-4-deoxychorismate lyase